MLNISNFPQYSPEQIVSFCNDMNTKTALIIAYSSSLVILWLGYALQSSSKKSFSNIWWTFAILFGIVIVSIYLLPNAFVQNVTNFFSNFFSNWF